MALVALVATLSLGACATVPPQSNANTLATAALANASGQSVGSVEIVQSGTTVMFRANVSGQASGEHGIHLHTTGRCEAPGFTTAGGHLNPTAHQHGSLNPAGPHVGDLPNIIVGPDGNGMIASQLTGTAADLLANLFDADGTAIVLHAGPDDYKTDPSGNSGGRIACGVLLRFLL
ncbi:superoxide dismutase family protein [Novosphingobium sp. AAP83]|uniref:superoxide dismutase family protein n=1 Tax=Novosphingobium sp. AAP83 TaxID=1523425 RepID=UPI001E3F7850|nr:superoxide dismutase family protein [Novosphingobium sp. AAP83]